MQFDIITIFPKIFDSYFKESLMGKAIEEGILKVNIYDLRDYTTDPHRTVDQRPFGGGEGMVMKIGPIWRAVEDIAGRSPEKKESNSKVILFTPRGEKFNQETAFQFSRLNQIIMICGRYEGVDERVAKYVADKHLSIGDYVLMGGEVPAMVVVEAVSRLIPGVIGDSQLPEKRSFLAEGKKKGFIEYPQYTRPEVFSPKPGIELEVPKVLLSGDHQKIKQWRKDHRKIIS